MSGHEAAATWGILRQGKKKEGPYTLTQLGRVADLHFTPLHDMLRPPSEGE